MGKTFLLLAAASLLAPAAPTSAATFYIDYSGAAFLNHAEAHGMVTIDDALFGAPAGPSWLTPGVEITAFYLEVSNASSGNGNFQLADFDGFTWDTAGASLDPAAELLSQPAGTGNWGGIFDGTAGDFGPIALNAKGAPTAAGFFTIATDGGIGDSLYLASIRPVPLPAAAWLFASALGGLGIFARHKRSGRPA